MIKMVLFTVGYNESANKEYGIDGYLFPVC
jgi:hypothetical protein